MFPYFWGVSIVILPFFIKIQSVVDVRTSQNFLFIFLCFLSLFIFGFKPKRKYIPIYLIMVCFLIAAFIFQENSFFDYTLIQWVCTSLGLIVAVQMMSNFKRQDLKIIVPCILAAGTLESLWVILNYFQFDLYEIVLEHIGGYRKLKAVNGKWVYSDHVTIAGSLSHKMLSGSFIAVIMPLLIKSKRYILIPLYALGIYLCDSAMATTTAVIGVLTYILLNMRAKRITFPLVGIGLISAFIYGYNNSGFFEGHRRVHNWKRIIKIHDGFNIVKGGGPGYLETTLSADEHVWEKNFRPAHNILLDVYSAYGVLGVLAVIILIAYLLRIILQNPSKEEKILISVIIAMLFNAMGSFPFHISATALLFMIISTILIAKES